MRMCDIRPVDIVRWQNSLTGSTRADGDGFKPTYLRIINNQLNAIFNHAERYYNLEKNPVHKVDKMGSKEAGEMQFWTKDEYLRFSDAISDKPLAFYAFEVLYWMGIRCGELMALTPSDFLLETSELRINKSYQRLRGEDVVTKPKTRKSVRTIKKHFLVHEMDRGCKASGVKRIRIHDLRHSHVSLLINMGFSALDIAERVGHEAIDITYRYAHLFPAKRAQIADALSELRGE